MPLHAAAAISCFISVWNLALIYTTIGGWKSHKATLADKLDSLHTLQSQNKQLRIILPSLWRWCRQMSAAAHDGNSPAAGTAAWGQCRSGKYQNTPKAALNYFASWTSWLYFPQQTTLDPLRPTVRIFFSTTQIPPHIERKPQVQVISSRGQSCKAAD